MRLELKKLRTFAFVSLVSGLNVAAFAAPGQPVVTDIGVAYAADAVNASVFRNGTLATLGGHQFVTYYDGAGHVVVGRRDLPSTTWDLAVQPFKGNVKDAHNDSVIGISGDGTLHLSYDHHRNPLHYRVSAWPFDIRSFGDEIPMTGDLEKHVTYPEFINAPDGSLYFFYRDGTSGNGNLLVNRYDATSKKWSIVAHPLVSGENKRNPYWWRPAVGSDNVIHLAWCWRDSSNAQSNHDLCYTQSADGGKTWLRSDGTPQHVPVTLENAEVVDPIGQGQNLINQCSTAVDSQNHPHLAQYFNDDAGVPQYFDVWFDGKTWHRSQVSHRTKKFSVSGGGSLAIMMSRPEIVIGKSGLVCFITRDAEYGSGVRLYLAGSPFEQWKPVDVLNEDLGNWEPTYDLSAARDADQLNLFVLPVKQGNHEHVSTMQPQMAKLLQMPLP